MRDISAIEINVLVKELNPFITKSRIKKIYFLGEDSFRIAFYKENKTIHLYIKLLKTINETKFSETADEPNNFVMGLRKRLENRIVNSISQINYDRILQFSVGKEKYLLTIEMLGKGNIILVNETNNIEICYKSLDFSDRTIRPNNIYILPKNDSHSLEEAIALGTSIFSIEDTEKAVSRLSKSVNLGPLYVEDILKRANIDPKNNSLSEKDKQAIINQLKLFSERLKNEKPCVYFENGKVINYSLCEILKYSGLEKKEFEGISEALDYIYFSERSYIKDDSKQQKINELKINISKQEHLAVSLFEDSKKYSKIGKILMERMYQINEAINFLNENKRITLEEFKRKFPEIKITKLDLKNKTFTIEIDD